MAHLGETERAEAWAKRALAADREDPAVLYNVCCAYAMTGKIEDALDLLEQCAIAGFHKGKWLEHDSSLDPLRGHPRFQAIVIALGSGPKGHA
ncbi:MAG TPA: hypothetical protein VFU41_07090 [Gemmatimonadales bacterium]|nr:hypothetical protein [Gemmatimonadales bacterium]